MTLKFKKNHRKGGRGVKKTLEEYVSDYNEVNKNIQKHLTLKYNILKRAREKGFEIDLPKKDFDLKKEYKNSFKSIIFKIPNDLIKKIKKSFDLDKSSLKLSFNQFLHKEVLKFLNNKYK
jgi:hypothetical protein